MQNLWEESIQKNLVLYVSKRDLLTFALVELQAFVPLFNAQIKHVLNYFALKMDAICCY